MKWLEIKVTTTTEASDAVSDVLTDLGASGVAIQDPNDIRMEIERPGSLDYANDEFLESLGSSTLIRAYFQEGWDRGELISQINERLDNIARFLDVGDRRIEFSEVDDEDWSTAWKKYYKPFHIAEDIVVKPTWEPYDLKPGEILIELDPGMAFGTGTHETTSMCAKALRKYVKSGDTVMDVGCGSGILSVIAAKLGASSVVALDIDEVAARVARENCAVNEVQPLVRVERAILSEMKREKYDLVVANIIADVIVDISSLMPYYVKTGGIVATSGIIRERKAEVVEAYRRNGFECIETSEMGEWVAIIFKCQGSL